MSSYTTSSRHTRNILFDLNSTLYDVVGTRKQAEQHVFSYLNNLRPDIPPDKFREINETIVSKMVGTSEQTFKTPQDYRKARFSELLKQLGISDSDVLSKAISIYQSFLSPIAMTDSHVVLEKLLIRRYQLGLITDGFSDVQHNVIKQLRFDRYFGSNVFISGEVGLFKPDIRFFSYAIRDMNASPSTSALVGDDLELDIRPAKAIGIFTVWLGKKVDEQPTIPPDITINGLIELLEIFPESDW